MAELEEVVERGSAGCTVVDADECGARSFGLVDHYNGYFLREGGRYRRIVVR